MSIEYQQDWNTRLEYCGCCPMPLCPPPTVLCQSIRFGVVTAGFVVFPEDSTPDSDSTTPPCELYLSQTASRIWSGINTSTDSYLTSGGTSVSRPDFPYDSRVVTGSLTRSVILEYDQGWSASAVQCGVASIAAQTTRCEILGSFQEEENVGYVYDSPELRKVLTLLSRDYSYEEISGELNPAYTQWESDFAQWEIDFAEYEAEYQEAYDEWVDGGMVGPEPDYDPPVEPNEPAEPVEPIQFWPPCTFKTTTITTFYEVVFEDGEPFAELVESTPEDPNPLTEEFLDTILRPPSSATEPPVEYENATTVSAELALGLAWVRGEIEFPDDIDSTSDKCAPEANCTAFFGSEELDCTGEISGQDFRYRLCVPAEHEGTYFRAEWDEVFYPEGWDDSQDSDPPLPVVTPKSWEWTGPPGGANDSDSNPSNDTEDRCSPWGLVVKVPDGQEGFTVIRNMRTSCYAASPYGTKYTLHESFGIYVEP
jgi:hypothetical protein